MSLDIALACAARGWGVFPVRVRFLSGNRTEKIPAVPWSTAASRDPEVVRAWWEGEHRGLHCGVVTGKASDLYVVDVDTPEALAWVAPLVELGAEVPTNRGVHYYFCSPADGLEVRNSAIDGLDVRGDGGMVVAWNAPPPWLAPLPRELAEWARTRTSSGGATPREPDHLEVVRWPGGGSDNWVVAMIGGMLRRGWQAEACLAALLAENDNGRFDPPCDVAWLAQKVEGVYGRYERGSTNAEMHEALARMRARI